MIHKKLTEEQAKSILKRNQVPEDAKVKGMPAFAVYAELDTTKQLLRTIRPFTLMVITMPPGLPTPASEVLRRLFRCFAKDKSVSEGLIGDMMWGFSHATAEEIAIPAELTWAGLCQLRDQGYVTFQGKDGALIDSQSDQIGSAWVRYQPKLLEMVYERGPSGS